jgi:hypothetical protein
MPTLNLYALTFAMFKTYAIVCSSFVPYDLSKLMLLVT